MAFATPTAVERLDTALALDEQQGGASGLRGWLLAAVGLIGKVLGPIGLLQLIWSGAWPRSTIVLSLTNDLIWWIPFVLYLYDAWPAFRQGVFGNQR